MTTQIASPASETDTAIRVLLVDEDDRLTDVMESALAEEGWQVRIARTGHAAVDDVSAVAPDVILLDRELPDADGRDVAAVLRSRGVQTPIVLLSMPFGTDVVVAQVEPILRRLGRAPSSRRLGDLVLDVSTGEVWRDAERIVLNPLEFEMLRELVQAGGQTTTLGGIVRAAAGRGIRITRETAAALLPALRRKLDFGRVPMMRLVAPDAWVLAV